MIQEIKISSGTPDPDPPSSVCPGSCQTGDRYEGPVSAVEGAGQRGDQSGRPQHSFPAMDIREQGATPYKEMMSCSALVEAMTRHCCQKKAGQYQLPALSAIPSCIFCTLGCKCLGPNCMGPPKKSTQSKTRYPPSPPATLPGLLGNSTLTTLTTPQKTPSTNLPFKRSQSLIDLFRCTTTQAVLPVSQRSSPQPRRKSSLKLSQKIFSLCSTSAYDAEVLQQLLRSCGRRKSSHKSVTARSSAPPARSTSEPAEAQVKIRGSYLRKLSVSEAACIRKKTNSSSEKNIFLSTQDITNDADSVQLFFCPQPTLNRELVTSSSSNSDELFSEIPLFQLFPQMTPWPTLYPPAGPLHAGDD